MPKFKPHSGTKKRVRVTGSGKLARQKAGKRHLLTGKSAKQKRNLDGRTTVHDADHDRINRMLGR